MSTDPVINVVSTDSKTSDNHDEISNHSIEIPEPPKISLEKLSSSSDSSYTDIDSDSNSDDDNEDGLPMNLTFDWLEEQMRSGVDLRPLLRRILPGLPEDVSQSTIFEILMDLFLPFRQRKPLEQYQTFDHAVELIRTRKNIIVLTGAGISVSCGSNIKSFSFLIQFFFYSSS